MSLLFWSTNPVAAGSKKSSYFRYSLCVNMERLFFFYILNFRFIIYVTATTLICYENSVENEPFGQLIMMILHIFSLKGSAHLYLVLSTQNVI